METLKLPIGPQQSVELLERLLAEAKAGRINGLAVVIPRAGDVDVLITGAVSAADLYFGAGLLQHKVFAAVVPDKPSSPLLRAGVPR